LAILAQQTGLDFLGPPMPVPLARMGNPFDPLTPHAQRDPVRAAGMIPQIPAAAVGKTAQPFVSRFATDAKGATPGTDRTIATEQRFNQLPPLPNERCVFPRHNRGNPDSLPKKLLPMSCNQSVTHVLIPCREGPFGNYF
jgi:hypothetical protein